MVYRSWSCSRGRLSQERELVKNSVACCGALNRMYSTALGVGNNTFRMRHEAGRPRRLT